MALRLGGKAIGATADPTTIKIRPVQLQQAVDAVNRASTAAKQAQRLCATAARAFGDEAIALDECKNTLEAALSDF